MWLDLFPKKRRKKTCTVDAPFVEMKCMHRAFALDRFQCKTNIIIASQFWPDIYTMRDKNNMKSDSIDVRWIEWSA
jgi:hypothetical protein